MCKKVIRKSLKTNNLTIAIVIKLKILNYLNINNINPTTFYSINDIDRLNLVSNDEIDKLLIELSVTVKKALNIEPPIIKVVETDKSTLKDYTEQYLIDKLQDGTSKKTMLKYKQACDFLHSYFGVKCKLRDISFKQVQEFKRFLFEVPKHWKLKHNLKGKDIKKLIDKKSVLLQDYEPLTINTVAEIVKRCKSIFRTFERNGFVDRNHFMNLDNVTKKHTVKREFEPSELKSIFNYCLREDKREIYNFLKCLLYLGLRRGECLSLQVKNIVMDKYMIEVLGTKSVNAKRITIIHKDLVETIQEQIKGKSETDYLFFDEITREMNKNPRHKNKTHREKQDVKEYRLGIQINGIIKDVLGADIKKFVDIHSIRKNTIQELYMVEELKELELKSLVGHSTSSDITDKHYLLGKRDYKSLKIKIDKASFSHYFE